MTPMDGKSYIVVKQRIQLNREMTPIQMANHMISTEGVKSLYRSLPITVTMNIPQAALFMTIYENLKSYLFPDGNVGIMGYFACAGIAGGLSAGITTPMDVVKTRLQTQTEESNIFSKLDHSKIKFTGCKKPECKVNDTEACREPRYCSVKKTVRLILEEDGALAFYRGVLPRMLLFLPGAAVSWSVYEHIKTLLVSNQHS
jgi:solute carrier family 25 iron transporter 28/37